MLCGMERTGSVRRVMAGLILAFASGCVMFRPSEEKLAPLVVAHYFNWFQTPDVGGSWRHWEWKGKGPQRDPNVVGADGRREICSVYHPVIGAYDSSSRDVMEYHLLTARAAKLDGFFVDWYGIPSLEEKLFGPLLDVAGRFGFTMCVCFEDKAMFGYHYRARDRREAVSNAIANLEHILETHGRHPAYLKIGGAPVVINFSWQEPDESVNEKAHGFSAAEWAEILAALRRRHEIYFVHDYHGHLKESYWDASDNLYPWLDVNGPCLDAYYAEARRRVADGKIGFVSTLVYPGFDNTGVWGWGDGPFVTPREDGAFYARSWERALTNDAWFVQVATWNDFGEGATIEPTDEYGFKYLEMTESYAARLKGVQSDGGRALKLPLELYRARRSAGGPARAKELDRVAELIAAGRVDEAEALLRSAGGPR